MPRYAITIPGKPTSLSFDSGANVYVLGSLFEHDGASYRVEAVEQHTLADGTMLDHLICEMTAMDIRTGITETRTPRAKVDQLVSRLRRAGHGDVADQLLAKRSFPPDKKRAVHQLIDGWLVETNVDEIGPEMMRLREELEADIN